MKIITKQDVSEAFEKVYLIKKSIDSLSLSEKLKHKELKIKHKRLLAIANDIKILYKKQNKELQFK